MSTRNVLHIIKSLGRGGAETLLPETLKFHDSKSFSFHYIYFLSWKDQLVDEIKKLGGNISCLPASNNIGILLRVFDLIRYIRRNDIQLIHCHLPWAGLVGRLVFKLTNIPVIYTEHNKQERYHWITYLLNKITFNWQTQAISVSEDVHKSITKKICPKIPVKTILNGVNVEYYKRDEPAGNKVRSDLDIPKSAIVVGVVAVFRVQKRLVEWIRIFKNVSRSNANIYGIIVGDGPLREEVFTERARLGLENIVFIVGQHADVRPWLSAMDIFMMTSKFEGLPLALLEAMSMECAVVATSAGGVGEVIIHQENGLKAEVDNLHALSGYLERLVSNNELRRNLAKEARLSVTHSLGMERMVRCLETEYVNCLQQSL